MINFHNMSYRGSKLKGNKRKLGLGRETWTTGIAPVVLQSCLGGVWQESCGGCRGTLTEQSKARHFAQHPGNPDSSFQRRSWHPETTNFSSSLAKNQSAHNPAARSHCTPRKHSGVTAAHSSAPKRHPQGQRKMNEHQEFGWFLESHSVKGKISFFLDPDTCLRNESSKKKKEKKNQTTPPPPKPILDCVSHFVLVFKTNNPPNLIPKSLEYHLPQPLVSTFQLLV